MFPQGAARMATKGNRTTSAAATELPPILNDQTGSIKRPELGAADDGRRVVPSPERTGAQPGPPLLDARPQQQVEIHGLTQQAEPAPAVVATLQGATPSPPVPQPSEGVSALAKPSPDASPEQQANAARQLPLRFEPAPVAVAPSPPAPPSPDKVSTQVKPAPEARPEQPPPKTAAISDPQSALARGSSTALLDSDEITTLIDRGSAFLKRGDLASARLLLRRAADAGSADAALMLGSTFDPAFIQQLGVIGIQPDVGRAREWYQKAAELGSDAATQRLANLKNQ
jgi:hypothetical protein